MFYEALAASSAAGLATAIASVITSLGILIGGAAVFIPMMRGIKKDVKEVHTLVNQQLTDSKNYQAALIRALRAHDVEVPEDQSNPI
jgi:citrate synthase